MFQTGCIFLLLLVNCMGSPLSRDKDTSSYFDGKIPLLYESKEVGHVSHMVALVIGAHTQSFLCGASLITKHHVLTAAHCIDVVIDNGPVRRSVKGIVGTNYWNRGGTRYSFSHNITHPKWNSNTVKNDIGILITSQQVTLNKDVQMVTLNFDFIGGNIATIINGWGYFQKGSEQASSILRELRLHTLDSSSCVVSHRANDKKGSSPTVDPKIEICTVPQKNRGTCYGDSGGPLLLEDTRQQIGIVSWGHEICGSEYPDVYVRISAYKSWIQRNIRL